MATDQAAPSSDIQKRQAPLSDKADETVRLNRPQPEQDETLRMRRPATPAKPASAKSILEKTRKPRRSFKEFISSTDGKISLVVYLISFIVHGLVLAVLALIFISPQTMEDLLSIVSKKPDEVIDANEAFKPLEQPDQIHNDAFEDEPQDLVAMSVIEETSPIDLNINDLQASIPFEDDAFSAMAEMAKDGDLGGRLAKGRKGLVEQQGGNAASEISVIRTMKWLASIQQPDGSWSFSEIGESADPGSFDKCEMGATGMVLMAFLGAGHTHVKEGPYQKNVEAGLAYLLNNARIVPAGADFRAPSGQGNMYVQGICCIALAEAYGMTKDQKLKRAAEGGLKFIMNAQNPKQGGWRYDPNKRDEPGDTSVVGWQLMALVSGHGAGIQIPRSSLNGVSNFLNEVQTNDGAQYGYTGPQAKDSMTAVGLLCRMYLGWANDTPALQQGVLRLGKVGPSKTGAYYNYYATQVMHHIGGPAWEKWNAVMRDQLVNTQATEGPEKGSWPPRDAHGPQGGRLYETCLNVMCLEVYYRHLPLYQRNAVQAEF